MISILCLSCNAIFSVVSFRGQHAEVGDFPSFFLPFLAGRGVCCDFFDIIYEGKVDRNERVTEKGKRPEPTLHKNGKLVQLLTKMPTFSCSLKQELF